MTLQQKKEGLFEAIRIELSKHCDKCLLGDSIDHELCKDWLECSIPDDWNTAILSLDSPHNWPNLFEV